MSTKLSIYSLDGAKGGQKQMPMQFAEPVRADLIKKAVLSLQSRARQPYGADPEAGKKHSTYVSRRRRDYRGSYGKGISRVPRKVLSRRGSQFNWVGAFAPGMVGGRRAHPPKASKDWTRDINKKENRKAIRAALAATIIKDVVAKRGHVVPENYPFIVADAVEQITKTKDLVSALSKLGFDAELARAQLPVETSGKAARRGHSKGRKSVLLVVSSDAPVMLAAANVPGMDCAAVHELNAEILAPGTHAGRITLYTEAALKIMEEKKLFI